MRSLLSAILFVSATAVACPELAGTYRACRSATGYSANTHDITITQALVDGVTTYTMTQTSDETNETKVEVFTADGSVYSVEDEIMGAGFTLTTKASCNGNNLNIDQNKIFEERSYYQKRIQAYKTYNGVELRVSMGNRLVRPTNDLIICR